MLGLREKGARWGSHGDSPPAIAPQRRDFLLGRTMCDLLRNRGRSTLKAEFLAPVLLPQRLGAHVKAGSCLKHYRLKSGAGGQKGRSRQCLPESGLGERKGHGPPLRVTGSSLPEGLYVRPRPRYATSAPQQGGITHRTQSADRNTEPPAGAPGEKQAMPR